MDSTVVQSNVQEYNEHHHPHNVGSQEENQPHHDHEKKSVLKRVKEKARKIKDTIKKHAQHEHEHDHEYHYEDQHIRHDHDLDEELENDEEEVMAKDPVVRGAPIYHSANVESTIAGEPSVNFASTRVMEEEHHQEPRIVVVTATTESDQNRATEAAKVVVDQEEKTGQPIVNLERPIGLEEDRHAPGSRPEAYTPSNYETKVADPTGASAEEADLTQVQESLARMDVQDEAKASPESNVLPTGYTSTGSHDQFLTEMSHETKTQYSSAASQDKFLPDPTLTIPNKVTESIEPESEVLTVGTQYPCVGSHGQFIPDMPTASHKTQYPSVGSDDQFNPEPIPTNSNIFPENLQGKPKVLPVAVHTQCPSVKSHDQVLPDMSASTKTQYPSAAISNETPKVLPEVSTANETQNPSIGSHDQFAPEFIPTKLQESPQVSGQILNTTTRAVQQPHGDITEQPSNHNSYTEKISSATSAIADKAVSAKNPVASKLGYDEEGDKGEDENEIRDEEYRSREKLSNRSSFTENISSATSAVAGKAVSPDNLVASKLGYDEKGDRDENETRQEDYGSEEKPSNQSSYTEKISSAASAIADKAVSAKDVVASKLGYDKKGDRNDNETRQEEYRSWEKPSNQSSYTEKISPATSAIADNAVSAKNIVASKLGYDGKGDRYENQTRQEEYKREEKPANESSYTEKISTASAIADTAVSAKNIVASKLGYDKKVDGDENETRQEESRSEEKPSNHSNYTQKFSSATSTTADKAVSAKNVVATKFGYDEEGDKEENKTRHEEYSTEEKPLNQSSYPETISSGTSAIADKAVSAKNVIASKLGYGEKGDMNDKVATSEVRESRDSPTVTESSAEYAQKITISLTEELAPVYGQAGGAEPESAAISKEPETSLHATDVTTNETESGVPVQDKGVSVKDYLAEKLRPGDEDMALKEVITDALFKQKEKLAKGNVVGEDRTASEVVADAIHKQEEPKIAEHKHLDKVTESDEVERRLSTGNEKSNKGYEESHVNSPRSKGVIDKVKDVVGSWFGKPGDSQSSQVAGDGLQKNIDGEEAHVAQRVEEERRL